ncbi:MAG TPA: hypothetical protein PK467_05585 [Candidatus Wallbacteria bacterium]|nr:hypothetical protein [Candidatus Wallbacteria bacterium]
MKKCDRLEKILNKDGGEFEKIASGQSEQLCSHIKSCADCAAYFALAAKTRNMLAGLKDFEEKIDFKIQDEQAKVIAKIKAARPSSNPVKSQIYAVARPSIMDLILNAFKTNRLAGALGALLIAALIYSGLAVFSGGEDKNRTAKDFNNENKLYSMVALSAKAFITISGVRHELNETSGISKGSAIETEAGCVCVLSSKLVRVTLQPLTAAVLDERHIRIASGRALMEFDKAALDSKSPFIVDVNKINVEITGTTIEVEAAESVSSIKLIGGKIRMRSEDPNFKAVGDISLKPGEKITLNFKDKSIELFNDKNLKIKNYTEGSAAPKTVRGKTVTSEITREIKIAPAAVIPAAESAEVKTAEGSTAETLMQEPQPDINNGPSPFISN